MQREVSQLLQLDLVFFATSSAALAADVIGGSPFLGCIFWSSILNFGL
jgi:hypothetical protein